MGISGFRNFDKLFMRSIPIIEYKDKHSARMVVIWRPKADRVCGWGNVSAVLLRFLEGLMEIQRFIDHILQQ